jgi:YfiH family protein
MNLSFRVGDQEENVRRNREIFFGSLGIGTSELAVPGQVHSTVVVRVGGPGSYPACDALITDARRVFLCVSVADCVPLLLYDPGIPAVAAVHAGWRGVAGRIVERAVGLMQRDLAVVPGRLRAYLGPSASVCCYAVGEEVASQFDPRFVQRDGGRFLVDLKQAARQQLLDAGVPAEQIEVSPSCTISEAQLFHSFRRDGERSGRMMAVIGLG